MGLIDSAIFGAMEAVGSGMMDAGNFFLKGGYSVWGSFSKVAMRYVQQQPESLGAWQVVTGSVYTLSTGIAASLSVLFFVLGWMRNSVEIRNNFSIDEVFKFCIDRQRPSFDQLGERVCDGSGGSDLRRRRTRKSGSTG